MSTFVETIDGKWVNLDHAAEIGDANRGGWFVRMVSGDIYHLGFGFDPETLARHSVPAAANLFVLYVFFPDDNDATGTPSIERSPLVAWRIDGGRGATPVAFDFEASLKAIEYPDGRIYTESGLTFPGLAEYIEHRREEWREESKYRVAKTAAQSKETTL